MIGEAIGSAAQSVNESVADPAREKIKELQDLLPHRPEIVDEEPIFIKGTELATPDGSDPTVPAVGTETGSSEDPSSNMDLGLPIEFIHFGRVHRDGSSLFVGTDVVDDTKELKPEEKVGGRAVYFRAALQREAMFLGGLAKSITTAMEEKDQAESGIGDLVTMAADLLGGQGGTKSEPSPADMMQFLDKIATAYNKINKEDVTYTELHEAGIEFHTIRATLLKYLHDLVPKKKEEGAEEEEEPSVPNPTGMLSNLPMVGELPIPGPIGDVITYMRKVTGKLYDVQNTMIYGLVIAMRPAIEQACRDITLDFLRDARTPIYPVWGLPEVPPPPGSGPFANMQADDPITGPLADTPLGAVNDAVQGGVGSANSALNAAAKEPLEVIDFLSKPYPAPPGGKYLDAAFQAGTETEGIFGGSEKLGEIAVAAFYAAISDDPPEFLQGFVADFLSYVFAVDLEFLRGVYRVLCAMPADQTIAPSEVVAAGSVHLVAHFIDLITSKLGLDDMIKNFSIPIPAAPVSVPGINWPEGDLNAAPIAEELKKLLAEKIGPYLSPVVEYAMNGLAYRLNVTRGWAQNGAFTMEAHLAALPAELTFLFRNTFGPLWSFINETIYGIVGEKLKEALGPAADALGVAGDALTTADTYIADAQKWAQEAAAYATDVEQKAGAVMSALSNVGTSQTDVFGVPVPTGLTGVDGVQDAVGALTDAAGANPFSDPTDPFAPTAGESFPKTRVVTGKGKNIEQSEYDQVSANHKYEEAKEEGESDDPNADPNAEPNASGSGGSSSEPSSSGSSSSEPTGGAS